MSNCSGRANRTAGSLTRYTTTPRLASRGVRATNPRRADTVRAYRRYQPTIPGPRRLAVGVDNTVVRSGAWRCGRYSASTRRRSGRSRVATRAIERGRWTDGAHSDGQFGRRHAGQRPASPRSGVSNAGPRGGRFIEPGRGTLRQRSSHRFLGLPERPTDVEPSGGYRPSTRHSRTERTAGGSAALRGRFTGGHFTDERRRQRLRFGSPGSRTPKRRAKPNRRPNAIVSRANKLRRSALPAAGHSTFVPRSRIRLFARCWPTLCCQA